MLVKFENQYGAVWVETRNVLWVTHGKIGARIFAGDDLYVDVAGNPEAVAKKLNEAEGKR